MLVKGAPAVSAFSHYVYCGLPWRSGWLSWKRKSVTHRQTASSRTRHRTNAVSSKAVQPSWPPGWPRDCLLPPWILTHHVMNLHQRDFQWNPHHQMPLMDLVLIVANRGSPPVGILLKTPIWCLPYHQGFVLWFRPSTWAVLASLRTSELTSLIMHVLSNL